MSGRIWKAAGVLALAAACATGGRRPRFGAAPEARVLQLAHLPSDSVVKALVARAAKLGIRVTRSAAREGYVETTWYDLVHHAATEAPFDHLDSIVKFRFFVDPVQGKTRVLAEAMHRIAWDPSLPDRDLERMVGAGHPALTILDSMLVVVTQDTVKTDTTKATGGPPLMPVPVTKPRRDSIR